MEEVQAPVVRSGGWRPWPVGFMETLSIENLDKGIRMHGASLDVISKLAMRAPGATNKQARLLNFAAGCWHAWGRQSFRVAPVLAEALRETSLNLVPAEVLRSPYPALWIEGGLEIRESGPRDIGVFLISGEVGRDPIFEIAPGQTAFPIGTRALIACALKEGPKPQQPFVFMNYVFLCRETLEESIEESMAFSRRMADARNIKPDPSDLVDDLARALWAFVANFVLYLSSPDPDLQPVVPSGLEKPPKSPKAREIQAKIRAREGEPRLVGYRLTRVVRSSAEGSAGSESTSGSPGRLLRPHLVRGHWKHQPFGPGRMERRIIWIAPYRRGDDGTEETLERTYAAG